MAKINVSLADYSDGDLSIKADFIIGSLTGNEHFPGPVPPLEEVSLALEAFSTALTNAKAGGKDLTMIKNKKRATLEKLLMQLGLWVQLQSNGDEIALSSSGYDLAKKRAPIGVLPKPTNFAVKPADGPGSVKLSMQAISGSNMYVYEYTPAPISDDSIWQMVQVPRSSTVISGLQSGSQYAFRSVALGTNPTRVYSDVISSYIL